MKKNVFRFSEPAVGIQGLVLHKLYETIASQWGYKFQIKAVLPLAFKASESYNVTDVRHSADYITASNSNYAAIGWKACDGAISL